MSSDRLHPTPSWHWYLIAAAGLLRFFNLGFRDLQAWDEALYAVRAQAVTRFGAWLDQSAYAIDGLYSSLHPPLHVWLTALAFQLFGEGEWTARIVSVLAGAATLPTIALIGTRLRNAETGLLAALLFGLNPFVTFYARQGQFDSLLVFFLTASLYSFLKIYDESNKTAFIVAGVSLGLALMTKLFVGILLPVALLLFLIRADQRPPRAIVLRIVASGAIAASISLPWHVFMAFTHAEGNPLFFFTQSALLQRTLYGIEGNIQPLEVFYYVNQMIVLFPAAIFFFFAGVRDFHRSKEVSSGILWAFFVVFFLAFSLMRTKLAVYVLPMMVPISLLAATFLWNEVVGQFRRTSWLVLLTGTFVSLAWSLSQTVRTGVKDIVRSIVAIALPDGTSSLLAGAFAATALLSVFLFSRLTSREWFPSRRSFVIIALLGFSGAFSLVDIFISDDTRYKDGATEIAAFVGVHRFQRIVVAGYERNPQLTYYLGGADIGWRRDISVRRILPPPSRTMYASWLIDELGGEPPTTLLLVEKDKFVRYETIDPQEFVPADYQLALSTRRYSAYVRAQADFFATREAEPINEIYR